MPIQLDDIQQATSMVDFNPKFFSSELTGKGGKVGLLNAAKNPGQQMLLSASAAKKTMIDRVSNLHMSYQKQSYTTDGTTITTIPLSAVPSIYKRHLEHKLFPNPANLCKLDVKTNNLNIEAVYFRTRVDALVLTTTKTDTSTSKKLVPSYVIEIYVPKNNNHEVTDYKYQRYEISDIYPGVFGQHMKQMLRLSTPLCITTITTDIYEALNTWVSFFNDDVQTSAIDVADMTDYIDSLSLYDMVCDERH